MRAIWFVVTTVVVGVVLLIWLVVRADSEARDYVASHDCTMIERREGYYLPTVIMAGKVPVTTMTWHPPRGYFQCTTGEGRWISIK